MLEARENDKDDVRTPFLSPPGISAGEREFRGEGATFQYYVSLLNDTGHACEFAPHRQNDSIQ
jgi:hypothetical protein